MTSAAQAHPITSRFDATSTAMDVVRGLVLAGKTAIVTGGAAGIGLEIVRALASAGCAVVIADRDVATAGRAVGPGVSVERLDLASLKSVREFAERALSRHERIDILINNAGVMACPLAYSSDGHEMQFAINYLGHYLLARLLAPALERAAPARIVSVSSTGHRRSGVYFDDIDYRRRPYDRWEAYGQSKTACALLAVALAEHLASRGVTCNAVNPGGTMTGLQRYLSQDELRELGWIDDAGKPPARWRTPAQCAATSVWTATAPELAGRSGLYLEYCRQAAPWHADRPMEGVKEYAQSSENARRLWDISGAMAGL